MINRIARIATFALSIAATQAAAQGYFVQDGFYDAWGNWIDTSYYVDQSAGFGGQGYYDAWGNWIDTSGYNGGYSTYDHEANMAGIAAMGAQSTANYMAADAASDARQAAALEMIRQ